MAILTDILRFVVCVLALFNVWWSRRGLIQTGTGKTKPLSPYYVVVFFGAVASLSFIFNHWLGQMFNHGQPYEAWRLLSFIGLAISQGQIAIGRCNGRLCMMEKLATFLECFPHALAMRDLHRADPGRAEEMAKECRRLTAAAAILE